MAEDRRQIGESDNRQQPRQALVDYLDELLADVEETSLTAYDSPAVEQGSAASLSQPKQQQDGYGPGRSDYVREEPASSSALEERQGVAGPGGEQRQRVAERSKLPQMPLPQVQRTVVETDVEQNEGVSDAEKAQEHKAEITPRRQLTTAANGQKGANQDPVPGWARPWFQAMIFHVGQLRIAVPLVKLHRVLRWDESTQVEPYAGQPSWVHGAIYHRKRLVRVVDTAELVLPPSHRPPLEERRRGKLLVVGDGSWALACQDVGDVFRLTPDQIQWRSQQGQQRWLAGTVSERLCALLDTDLFAQLLENEDDLQGGLASSVDPGQTVRVSRNSTDFR